MRRAFSWLQQRHVYRHSLKHELSALLLYTPTRIHCPQRTISHTRTDLQCRNLHVTWSESSDPPNTRASDFLKFDDFDPKHHPEKSRKTHHRHGRVPILPADKLKNPDAWIRLLEPYIPTHLQAADQDRVTSVPTLDNGDKDEACKDVLALLLAARKEQHAGVELLAHMVLIGRGEAAVHLMKMLLENHAARLPLRWQSRLPSNIVWPSADLSTMCKWPIQPSPSPSLSPAFEHDRHEENDPRYTLIFSDASKENTMTEIWTTLGVLIIRSADLEPEQSNAVMNAVMLVVGHIHNLDLVPEQVYSYRPSPFNGTVQRPPVLHLVSSRILTALSDATWREQQDAMIRKAASHGASYEDIGRDPPGGRFRLKVRPLGPELWLEFVLWCCVEGGFASAGARIIRSLRAQGDDPWFAVAWSPNSSRSHVNPTIDWDRVRARYGGSVGLKEGYSGDRPFVEMPSRTISTEVVLGLIESSINTIRPDRVGSGGVEVVQRNIVSMIEFLEPHDLPPSYFNFLATRLIQAEVFDLPKHPDALRTWYKNLYSVKSLQSSRSQRTSAIAFDLDTISTHSELFAGILQQALDAYVQSENIHRALDAFNELQELVDISKLQSIGSFLHQSTNQSTTGFFSGKPYRGAPQLMDFVGSHGQLPLYKLTSLLELATDTGLTGFGNWLLHNDDPDGPLITPAMYHKPSVARNLLRFAGLSDDTSLVSKVLAAQRLGRRRPTIKFLRALINTDISALRFAHLHRHLDRLAMNKGGGFGLNNFIYLAGAILKLEQGMNKRMDNRTAYGRLLAEGKHLLDSMLRGKYDERQGSYSIKARKMYRQQISCLLVVFQCYPDSILAELAHRHQRRFPQTNEPQLAPAFFNIFMEIAIQCKGAIEGIRLWESFCRPAGRDEGLSEDESLNEDTLDALANSAEPVPNNWDESTDTHGDLAKDGPQRANERPISNVPANATNPENHPNPVGAKDTLVPQSDIPLIDSQPDTRGEMDSPFFTTAINEDTQVHYEKGDALVVPNLRTLRLIIRSAVRERRKILANEGNADEQMEILDWAAARLKELGVNQRMIRMELEQSTKEELMRKSGPGYYLTKSFLLQRALPDRRVESLFRERNEKNTIMKR